MGFLNGEAFMDTLWTLFFTGAASLKKRELSNTLDDTKVGSVVVPVS